MAPLVLRANLRTSGKHRHLDRNWVPFVAPSPFSPIFLNLRNRYVQLRLIFHVPFATREEAIDAGADAGVGRRAVLERLKHLPELPLSLFGRDAERGEHSLLDVATVDADGAAEQLPAVADEVVRVRTDASGFALDKLEVLQVGRSERVVDGHPALFGVAPLQKRVFPDEGEREHARVVQLEAVRQLAAEGI